MERGNGLYIHRVTAANSTGVNVIRQQMSASGNRAVYSKGHWSLCLLNVECCVILGLTSGTGCLLSEAESLAKRRGADLLVSAPLSPITLMVCCIECKCMREKVSERSNRRLSPHFLVFCNSAQQLTSGDQWLTFLWFHTQTHTHTKSRTVSKWWVSDHPSTPPPLPSIHLCQIPRHKSVPSLRMTGRWKVDGRLVCS